MHAAFHIKGLIMYHLFTNFKVLSTWRKTDFEWFLRFINFISQNWDICAIFQYFMGLMCICGDANSCRPRDSCDGPEASSRCKPFAEHLANQIMYANYLFIMYANFGKWDLFWQAIVGFLEGVNKKPFGSIFSIDLISMWRESHGPIRANNVVVALKR